MYFLPFFFHLDFLKNKSIMYLIKNKSVMYKRLSFVVSSLLVTSGKMCKELSVVQQCVSYSVK